MQEHNINSWLSLFLLLLHINLASISLKKFMETEVAYDLFPYVRIYKDGQVERLMGTDNVSPSLDEKTGIQSRDIAISSNSTVSARLYIPKAAMDSLQKLPLLMYFHGGGFLFETAQSPTNHNYLNALVTEANVIAISVDYRRAPEEWLNSHANLKKVFMAGDSAGGNIVHHMGIQLGEEKLNGIESPGAILVHPHLWGNEPLPSETTKPEKRSLAEKFWLAANPTTTGCNDPLLNPAMDPRLSGLGCKKVLVCVAEKDFLIQRGWYYKELLRESGWSGAVEVMEAPGEDHVFHLWNPSCDNAVKMMKKLASFMNE